MSDSNFVKAKLIRRVYQGISLSPGRAVDIAPGVGFDMNDPLFPQAVPGPFQEAPNAEIHAR